LPKPAQIRNKIVKPEPITRINKKNPKSELTPGMTLWDYIQMQEQFETKKIALE
jgi:hypothetical protein